MRLVRVRSLPNVTDDRLLTDAARLADRLANGDDCRDTMVRLSAKRVLVLAELAARGHDVDVPGKPDACRKLLEYMAWNFSGI